MARLKHIQRRLDNWAIWSMRNASGGRGFATQSVLVSETWSRGSYNHMMIPVEDEEAWETDQAVTSLKLTRSHLYVMLVHIYLQDKGVPLTAQLMNRAPSTIKAQLEQADHAIAAWLDAKAQERERKRVAAGAQTGAAPSKRSFTP